MASSQESSQTPFHNPASLTLSPWSYVTYPHCNGFTREPHFMVVGRFEAGETSLWKVDLRDGSETGIARFPVGSPDTRWDFAYFDIADTSDCLVARYDNALWLLELDEVDEMVTLDESHIFYRAPVGSTIHDLPSLSAKSDKVLVCLEESRIYSCLSVDISSGETETLLSKNWYANHYHYSPYDENWIGFSHEGPASQVHDRMWLWHPQHAPDGICVFDQQAEAGGAPLAVGHERWAFHDLSAVVVAYGESTSGPRGLYEIFGDEREPRLVSEGNRDWHCNISRNGILAVVDTTGDFDAPGKGWENAELRSDIMLINMKTGRRRLFYRARENAEGYEGRTTHPFHPHPTFDPSGKYLVFNDIFVHDGVPAPGVRIVAMDVFEHITSGLIHDEWDGLREYISEHSSFSYDQGRNYDSQFFGVGEFERFLEVFKSDAFLNSSHSSAILDAVYYNFSDLEEDEKAIFLKLAEEIYPCIADMTGRFNLCWIIGGYYKNRDAYEVINNLLRLLPAEEHEPLMMGLNQLYLQTPDTELKEEIGERFNLSSG
jgi:hypothetical protein